jgi:hypothetical protein
MTAEEHNARARELPTAQIRSCHSFAFHSGEWSAIEGVVFITPPNLSPRACYVVRFDNGDRDYWSVYDAAAEYEFRALPPAVFWRDPIFQDDHDRWCFWDETWASFLGPFPTEEIAREKLKEYADSL